MSHTASFPAAPPHLPDRLLVIDDARIDRTIAVHAATRVGFEATAVPGIAAARELLTQGDRFGYVVVDLSLGGGEDGLEILHTLAEYNDGAVVVFASGFDGRVLSASRRVARALGLKVAGVLRKPILPDTLCALLRQAPRERRGQVQLAAQVTPEELRAAIAAGDVQPWFQPKVSLTTGAMTGAEALARWIRHDGSFVSPADFIPVAEQHGLVGALTDAMLDQSLLACAHWRAQRPDCSVAVNVTPCLLDDPSLTARIEAALQRHAVPASALVLEITEGQGIPDTACATECLTRLRIKGIHLAVDDFGTGHSSLLALVRMPFNELKIDQAFVREALSDGDSRKVVRATASLARELGLLVTGEGVETEPVADLLREAGCHIAQGYLYGRALPAEAFEAQLIASLVMPGAGTVH